MLRRKVATALETLAELRPVLDPVYPFVRPRSFDDGITCLGPWK